MIAAWFPEGFPHPPSSLRQLCLQLVYSLAFFAVLVCSVCPVNVSRSARVSPRNATFGMSLRS